MNDQDKILNYLKVTGPSQPTRIAKNLKTDTLLASAHLSDLVQQGKIKVSSLKIGASPLYYLPGQEELLFRFAQGNINNKDYNVLTRLKEKGVLRENDLDLLSKVAVRNNKDFAVPLQVTSGATKEIFWKWHMLSDEETSRRIKEIVTGRSVPVQNELVQAPPQPQPAPSVPEPTPVEQPKQEPEKPVELPREEKTQESAPAPEKKEEPSQAKLDAPSKETSPTSKVEREEPVEKPKEEKATPEKPKEVPKETQKTISEPEKKPFFQKIKEKITKKKKPAADDFSPTVEAYLKDLEIEIVEQEIIRKNSEIDLIVNVPSVVGKMKYFCKAKSKRRADDKDLSAAYMQAQMKKLPLLFLYAQDLTSKAQEMLDSGVFENVIVKKMST